MVLIYLARNRYTGHTVEVYSSPSLSATTAVYAKSKFWMVYAVSIVFTFFSLFTAFSSSTYLERFISPSHVGIIYSGGALLSIVLFILIPLLLRIFGNVRVTIALMTLCVVALFFVGLAPSVPVLLVAFVTFSALAPILYLNIDIFSETLIGSNEGDTGSIRGLALTLMSVAALAAPYSMGLLVGDTDNLAPVYFITMGVGCLFIVLIIGAFRQFFDPNYQTIRLRQLLLTVYRNRNVRVVLYAHFLLQLFFAWIVIYFPLYLATEVGLSWRNISEIVAFGLLAYIIFEYPIGIIADKFIGEKEMMAAGLVILGISSAFIPVTASYGIAGWMGLMFLSRIGASLVEVTTESYFFKQVNDSDVSVMSLFRVMRPLAMFIGALLGTVTLFVLPLQYIFFVLGGIMATGTFATLLIVDTK